MHISDEHNESLEEKESVRFKVGTDGSNEHNKRNPRRSVALSEAASLDENARMERKANEEAQRNEDNNL